MTAVVDRTAVLNLVQHEMFADPFPTFAALRSDMPVARCRQRPLVRGTSYLLTRHEDVLRVHTDKAFSSDPASGSAMAVRVTRLLPRSLRLLTDSMVFKDDPAHKRLRNLVNKAFTPKMVAGMEASVSAIVDRLVDDMARSDGPVDLVQAFAVPLPLGVISDMLGVTDDQREQFHRAMSRFVAAAANPVELLKTLPTGQRMVKMFEQMAADRRAHPDDRLVTALVQAKEDSDELSDAEIVSMIFLLLLAGHDTTSNLLGTGMLALLDNPDQLARLRAEPDLIDNAVDELVRYTAPVLSGAPRILTTDVELHGQVLPKGSTVIGMIASANRDERVFDDPEQLDVGRDTKRHLGFAFGSHYCLGNQLARLEASTALRALLERFDDIELAIPREQVRFKMTPTLRGVTSLPLHLR